MSKSKKTTLKTTFPKKLEITPTSHDIVLSCESDSSEFDIAHITMCFGGGDTITHLFSAAETEKVGNFFLQAAKALRAEEVADKAKRGLT